MITAGRRGAAPATAAVAQSAATCQEGADLGISAFRADRSGNRLL